jgi:diguanylate cyclase (GGDEF)-like protein/PAS domain S-box-containing protein
MSTMQPAPVPEQHLNEATLGRLRAAQIHTISRYTPWVVIGSLINAIAVAVAFMGHPSQAMVWFWAALNGVLSGVFLGRHLVRHKRHGGPLVASARGIRRAVINGTAFGILWACVPAFFFPLGGEAERIVIICVSSGMLAGGAISLAAVPRAATAFSLTMAVGLLIGLAQAPSLAHGLIAVMCVVYVTLLSVSAASLAKMMRERTLAEIRSKDHESIIQLLLQDFAESSEDWLWAVDAQTRVERISERFTALTGIHEQEVIGKDLFATMPLPPLSECSAADQDLVDKLRLLIAAHEAFKDREIHVKINGERRTWLLSGKAIRHPDGTFAGYRGVGRDITNAKLHRLWLDATLGNISQGIIMFDEQKRVRVYNAAALELLNLPEDLLSKAPTFEEVATYQQNLGTFTDWHAKQRDWQRLSDLDTAGPVYIRTTDEGRVLEVRTEKLDNGGHVRTYVDITQQVRQQESIEAKEQQYRSLFEHAAMGIYRSSIDGTMLRANPELVRINGFENEAEMLAHTSDIAREWYVDPDRRDEFRQLMEKDGRVTDFVSDVFRYKTRERITVSENAWVVRNAEGRVAYYEGTLTDITARREAEAGMERLAKYDVMTGLPNRVTFRNYLDRMLDQLQRGGDNFAVLLLDLDHFKAINDTRGHPVGDELLRQVALRLQEQLRDTDMVARLGGDEFAIILPSIESAREAANLAERINKDLSRPFMLPGGEAVIGVSIGITYAPDDGGDADTLIRLADLALYRVKGAGRGGYQFFEQEMDAAARRRHLLENELRGALIRGEMELYFQPVVDADTLSVRSFEALMRWQHPTLGLLSPLEFIPLAEEVGLIHSLGAWALRHACETALHWPDHIGIAVNLSPAQFSTPGLFVNVKKVLEETGLAPHRLELEITESVLIDATNPVAETLIALRRLGVRIALDDFGTGYSSLGYLRRFAFDKIKIDRSFVREIDTAADAGAIIDALIKLAGDLRMSLTVEGVETEQQLSMLRNRGAKEIQGFLISKPVPVAELKRFLPGFAESDFAKVG